MDSIKRGGILRARARANVPNYLTNTPINYAIAQLAAGFFSPHEHVRLREFQ